MKDFWEDVHLNNKNIAIGDGDFALSMRGFDKTSLESFYKANTYLEIGPGLGQSVAESPATHKVAVDISEECLRKIKEQFPEVETYQINQCSLPQDFFDAITCISVVQHCSTSVVQGILKLAKDSLKVGGSFFIEGILVNKIAHAPEDSYSCSWLADDIVSMWDGTVLYRQEHSLNKMVDVWWLVLSK